MPTILNIYCCQFGDASTGSKIKEQSLRSSRQTVLCQHTGSVKISRTMDFIFLKQSARRHDLSISILFFSQLKAVLIFS